MLDREQILAKTALKKEKIHVKEWSGEVYITELTVSEFNKLNSLMMGDTEVGEIGEKIPLTVDKFTNVKIETVAMGVVNEDGTKILTRDEIEGFVSKSNALDFLYEKITELNKPKKN